MRLHRPHWRVVSEEATVTEHLEELRWRIIVGGAAILVCAAVAFALSGQILQLLLLPANGMQLKAFNLMDGVMLRWRIALYTGIIMAFPVWGFELYRFTSPGLHDRERRMLMPALVSAFFLFLLGAGFGYSMLWKMIGAMMGMFPHQVDYLPSANDYLSFVLFFLLVCGLRIPATARPAAHGSAPPAVVNHASPPPAGRLLRPVRRG